MHHTATTTTTTTGTENDQTTDAGEGDSLVPSVITDPEAKSATIVTENGTHKPNSSGRPSIHQADNNENEDSAYETRDKGANTGYHALINEMKLCPLGFIQNNQNGPLTCN